MADLRVLVIEDNADARILYRQALETEGCLVNEAKDGLEALRLLSKGELPDLILLDLSMPNMGGAEFMDAMRAREYLARIKIIVVSGWDDVRARATELGAWDYLRKPFELRKMSALLQRALREK